MNNNNFYKFIFFTIIVIFFHSCKTVEKTNNIVFDYEQFSKITFLSSEIEIVNEFNQQFEEPYLDHLVNKGTNSRLTDWLNGNILGIGNENKLLISIIDSAVQGNKIPSTTKLVGIFKKPDEIEYLLNLDVNFFIYDDSNNLLGKTNVKLKRTTTSASRISLSERDRILEDLIYISIKEYTIKVEENVNKYLKSFVL